MIINHNIAALNTHRQLASNNAGASKSLEKLSSGLRINRAGDDAAGLAISEKMRGQIRGLDMASKNSQDGISMIQTAEGALNETHSILQRMRELSVQSSNDTNTTQDRKNLQDEMTQLGTEIERIANTTEFNTKSLLNGSMGGAQTAATGTVVNSGNLAAGVVGATLLTAVTDASGNNIGIAVGDTITATWSVNGTQQTASYTVAAAADDMDDVLTQINLNATVGTAALAAGVLTVDGAAAGTAAQINGLSFEVKTATGTRKDAASNVLSNFSEGVKAKDARSDGSATFQIGSNTGQTMNLSVEDMRASTLGVNSLQIGTQSQAATAIKVVDQAIQKVSAERSKLGAVQNRLEHTINNLNTSSENLTAAESRVRDVDMAKEMMNFTKNNILTQASQAMLAQANQQPQGVLQLLR
ncbi:flagellin [Paenibacillus sp. LHD-117]|uniref:flagellin N-terminal helical domain-containing protein n=1 Tax=Paenibacillus sp. LHD-117 TaxID=3071412 RepID=UPI0027E0C032|nr:flagellin [Paenibacillus sp. LHD-117]MDQ6422501.1 flagellin [Paenibacillus sp. LHD-117]